MEMEDAGEQIVEAGSQNSANSMASSHKREHSRLKGYIFEEVKYGDFPHHDIYQQLFGYLPRTDTEARSSWLKEKGLVFSRDERCCFTFDNVTLQARDIRHFQDTFKKIEKFARDLLEKGGFFFFRESYSDGSDKGDNKIFNGIQVFRCPDGMNEALPKCSAGSFSEELTDTTERHFEELFSGSQLPLRGIFDKRKAASEEIERLADIKYGNGHREPFVSYHYKREQGQAKFPGLHLTSPWRRLW
jgi:hypothetical protein